MDQTEATSIMAKISHKIIKMKNGCQLYTGQFSHNGYGKYSYKKNGKLFCVRTHRVSWISKNGNIPEGMHVCHKCDVPNCVNPDHLFVGTHSDNMKDRQDKKRCAFGERHHMSKVKSDAVVLMRKMRESGMTCEAIAEKIGVTKWMVSKCTSGKTWSSVNSVHAPSHHCGTIKISDNDVLEIRSEKYSHMNAMQISKIFGVSRRHVSDILNNKTRLNVRPQP